MKSYILVPGILALAACAAMPDTVTPEIVHMSHVTQHRPFTGNPTEYGSNEVGVRASWLNGPLHFDIGEYLSLDKCYATLVGSTACGEIAGPREQFRASIGYTFKVNHD